MYMPIYLAAGSKIVIGLKKKALAIQNRDETEFFQSEAELLSILMAGFNRFRS